MSVCITACTIIKRLVKEKKNSTQLPQQSPQACCHLFYINSALLYKEPFHVNRASCSCSWRSQTAARTPRVKCGRLLMMFKQATSCKGMEEKGYFGWTYCLLIVQPVVLGATSRRGWKRTVHTECCGIMWRVAPLEKQLKRIKWSNGEWPRADWAEIPVRNASSLQGEQLAKLPLRHLTESMCTGRGTSCFHSSWSWAQRGVLWMD